MLPAILIGFSLGLLGSIINHYLLIRAYGKSESNGDLKTKKKFTAGFFLRHLINILILFLVRKNVAMLISAAFGLTMIKNYLLIQYTLGKKGVS
ncbi:MAG: hypothetical protein ACOYJ1_05245 [Peptococcales bacterium]|jgi:cytosine/uracil/thiamine/allantoin permease